MGDRISVNAFPRYIVFICLILILVGFQIYYSLAISNGVLADEAYYTAAVADILDDGRLSFAAPALPIYIAAGVCGLCGDTTIGLRITAVLFSILGGLIAAGIVSSRSRSTFTPILCFLLYQVLMMTFWTRAFFLKQQLALAFLPLAVEIYWQILIKGNWKNIMAAIGVSGLVLISHLPTTILLIQTELALLLTAVVWRFAQRLGQLSPRFRIHWSALWPLLALPLIYFLVLAAGSLASIQNLEPTSFPAQLGDLIGAGLQIVPLSLTEVSSLFPQFFLVAGLVLLPALLVALISDSAGSLPIAALGACILACAFLLNDSWNWRMLLAAGIPLSILGSLGIDRLFRNIAKQNWVRWIGRCTILITIVLALGSFFWWPYANGYVPMADPTGEVLTEQEWQSLNTALSNVPAGTIVVVEKSLSYWVSAASSSLRIFPSDILLQNWQGNFEFLNMGVVVRSGNSFVFDPLPPGNRYLTLANAQPSGASTADSFAIQNPAGFWDWLITAPIRIPLYSPFEIYLRYLLFVPLTVLYWAICVWLVLRMFVKTRRTA